MEGYEWKGMNGRAWVEGPAERRVQGKGRKEVEDRREIRVSKREDA